MGYFLLKLLPSMWPFLKEVFGGNKKPRGGHQTTPVFKYIAAFVIIFAVTGAIVFDTVRTLYSENQQYLVNNASLTQSVQYYRERLQALEAENSALKTANIAHERDLSAANARQAYADAERRQLFDKVENLQHQINQQK